MTDNAKTLEILQDLIQTCKDGEMGYSHAAGIVNDANLKSYFSQESLERARFARTLEHEAKALGEQPEKSGSIAGTLHRMWFEAKADLGLGDQSVLNSVEQGEDAAKKAYEKALEADLPAHLLGTIRQHAQSVIAAHDYVRDLRDHQDRADRLDRARKDGEKAA